LPFFLTERGVLFFAGILHMDEFMTMTVREELVISTDWIRHESNIIYIKKGVTPIWHNTSLSKPLKYNNIDLPKPLLKIQEGIIRKYFKGFFSKIEIIN